VAQSDVWHFHEVDKWAWNWFYKWKKLKSYPTIINIEHLYAIDYKNLVEMLVVFVDQIHKKNGTLYPLKCMTNILWLLFVRLCLYVICKSYVYGGHLGDT
jgi:hypothetical protein